jgi:hypothetical protein
LDPDPLVRGTDLRIRIRIKMSRIPNTDPRPSIAAGKASVPSIPILNNSATSVPDPIEAFMNPANPISPDSFVNVTASETIGHESNNVGQIADVPRGIGSSQLPIHPAVPPWDVPVPTPPEEYPRLEWLLPCHIITQIWYIVTTSLDKIK